MATVVIIHAAEDALPARALAEKLRAAKLTVQLEMPPGEELRNAAKAANAVLALWSPRSVEQSAMIEEVAAARSKGVIHARMQNAANPAQFRNEKSIDLTGWRGEDEFPAWRELAKAITAKAGVPAPPPPAPRPPSGFFQPGGINPPPGGAPQTGPRTSGRAPPPPPRPQANRSPPPAPPRMQDSAPRRAPSVMDEPEPKKGGGMMMIVIAIVALAVLGGGGFFVWNNMQASGASTAAWTSLDKTNPSAIRQFMAANPNVHHDDAQHALTALEESRYSAARTADTIAALQAFLSDFPDSTHALAARGRIAELRAAPTDATITDTATSTVTTANPDLLPPNATGSSTATTTTPPSTGGPVPLSPSPSTSTTTP